MESTLKGPAAIDRNQSLDSKTTTMEQAVEPPPVVSAGQIPMSFPAILRPLGHTDRFVHLREGGKSAESLLAPKKISRRDEKEGKRWVRRKENGPLKGSPHPDPSFTPFLSSIPCSSFYRQSTYRRSFQERLQCPHSGRPCHLSSACHGLSSVAWSAVRLLLCSCPTVCRRLSSCGTSEV